MQKKATLYVMLALFFFCYSAGFPPPQRLRRGVTSRFAGEEADGTAVPALLAANVLGATAPSGVVFLCLEPAGDNG